SGRTHLLDRGQEQADEDGDDRDDDQQLDQREPAVASQQAGERHNATPTVVGESNNLAPPDTDGCEGLELCGQSSTRKEIMDRPPFAAPTLVLLPQGGEGGLTSRKTCGRTTCANQLRTAHSSFYQLRSGTSTKKRTSLGFHHRRPHGC